MSKLVFTCVFFIEIECHMSDITNSFEIKGTRLKRFKYCDEDEFLVGFDGVYFVNVNG